MVNAMAGAAAAAVGTTTRSASDLAAGKQLDSRLTPLSQRSQPSSTVNDVLNAGSVDEAIAHANSVANSKPTQPARPVPIAQTPAPEPVKSEDVDAVTRQEIKTSLGDAILHRENGPISIKGDPASLKDILQRAGISAVPTRDGVLIGASQARKAREIFGAD